MSECVLGYDPGGNAKHGVALLEVRRSRVVGCRTAILPTVHDVIEWFARELPVPGCCPLGIGIDTLTIWGTGRSGWRPADEWLRRQYRRVQRSVMSPNTLSGAMSLNGMAVLVALREQWPDLRASETHPKVLYYGLTGNPHNWPRHRRAMCNWLDDQLGVAVDIERGARDHAWDAALSAWAAWRGFTGAWGFDLHALPQSATFPVLAPAGPSFFYWPAISPRRRR